MALSLPRKLSAITPICLLTFAANAHADCASLNGVYAADSVKTPQSASRSLTELVSFRERAHLYRVEGPAPKAPSFTGNELRATRKSTPLATTARVHYTAGHLQLTFMDASGKTLLDTRIASSPSAWKCVGDRLERDYETMGGLGERIRTQRTHEALFAADGDLHFTEATKIVEAPGQGSRGEAVFKRVAAPNASGK